MRAQRGFTLIEILIVVGIIGILAAAFLPALISGQATANSAAEQANMRWFHQNLLTYQGKYKVLPRGDGPRWILDPWVRGVVTHTLENFERFFTPGSPAGDYQNLKPMVTEDPHSIWNSPDEISSLDTDWAGPSADTVKGMRRLAEGMPLIATDNEGVQPTYPDGSINVLLGSGSTRLLLIDPDFLEYGYTVAEAETKPVVVGPESPHPLLQKLSVH